MIFSCIYSCIFSFLFFESQYIFGMYNYFNNNRVQMNILCLPLLHFSFKNFYDCSYMSAQHRIQFCNSM